MQCDINETENVKMTNSSKAFYNPAQKFNRDLSILVINTFTENISDPTILEAMSATGLRGIRYAKELKNNPKVFLNDISKEAIEEIKSNVDLNEVKNVFITNKDCNELMNEKKGFFNVIDLDPFGSCNVFIESALKSVKHNGLLCVTSTDTAVLCSHRVKCFAKYDTLILREPSCHEVALRTLLSFISRCAARNDAKVVPLLSVSVDYYVRVFLQVKKSKTLAKDSFDDNSYFFFCECFFKKEVKMNERMIHNECPICKRNMKLCGPFWNKALYDESFINRILMNNKIEERILGYLNIIKSEEDALFYYSLNDLSSFIKCITPSLRKVVNGLLNCKYKVSLTHCKLNCIKTDAPLNLIYDMIYFLNGKKVKYEFDFSENQLVTEKIRKDFFRKEMHSHLGPLKKK